jgi:hemolysin III
MGNTEIAPFTALRITEEVINSATHGVGASMGVVGLVFGLLTLVSSPSFAVSFTIYGVCLITLMTVSTLYHALSFTRARGVFLVLDYCSIFLLIAGSYTPFAVMLYKGWAQVILLAVIWTLTAASIALNAALPRIMARYGTGIYLLFGWLAVVFIPKLGAMPGQVVWLVVVGGLLYTAGAVLQMSKKPFTHTVWHVFVVAAACCHYFAITKLV